MTHLRLRSRPPRPPRRPPGRRCRRTPPPRRWTWTASRAPARSRPPGAPTPPARPGRPGCPTRRACSRSSAATVCRLFFTRWWISRMVASLVISSRSRRRTSVMSRTSTSAPIGTPAGHQRQRPGEHGRAARLDLLAGRRLAAQRGRIRSAASPPSSGSSASRLVSAARSSPTRWAASPSRRYADCAFGAGVGDLAAGVQPDQPVADPGRAGRLARVPGRREGAVGHHLGQVVGGGQVVQLQLAGGTRGGQVGVPADHRDHAPARRRPAAAPGSPRAGRACRRTRPGRPPARSGPG